MGNHPQADRRREPHADRERLLEHRMPRVERRHQEHAEQRRDGEVVPERRSQLHLLIVYEIRHDGGPPSVASNDLFGATNNRVLEFRGTYPRPDTSFPVLRVGSR